VSDKSPDSGTPGEGEHYFTEKPTVYSRPQEIAVRVRGRRLPFTTDRGVFSHGKADNGSKLLAETVEASDGDEILDWGCGWGLIGIVAALTWPGARVTMVDLNERACDLARANVKSSHVTNAEVVCGDASEVLGERTFDAILSNPPISAGRAAVLQSMDWAAAHLNPGGEYWMVVATQKGAKTLAKLLAERFATVEHVAHSGGFRVYLATEPIQGGTEQ